MNEFLLPWGKMSWGEIVAQLEAYRDDKSSIKIVRATNIELGCKLAIAKEALEEHSLIDGWAKEALEKIKK